MQNKTIEDKIIKTGKVKWRELEFLQKENFKEINKKQMKKLKTSILNNDFVETFKVWESGKKIYCLDGYHRCLALSELAGEGHQVPNEFTANFVYCKDKKDAAKKVLIYSSIYASVTDEGLYEFSHDFNLNFEEIKLEIDIPKLDLDRYEAGYVKDGELDIKREDVEHFDQGFFLIRFPLDSYDSIEQEMDVLKNKYDNVEIVESSRERGRY